VPWVDCGSDGASHMSVAITMTSSASVGGWDYNSFAITDPFDNIVQAFAYDSLSYGSTSATRSYCLEAGYYRLVVTGPSSIVSWSMCGTSGDANFEGFVRVTDESGSWDCEFVDSVSLEPTASPTARPTDPTPEPTARPTDPSPVPTEMPTEPTAVPSLAPTTGTFYCDPYTASNTGSALQNYVSCYFTACGGSSLEISSCDDCSGDTYARLYDDSDSQVFENDDYCGYCATIFYPVSGDASTCYDFELRQGCYAFTQCGGQFVVTGIIPEQITSSTPTADPTVPPSMIPTVAPTAFPTPIPSQAPSAAPSPPPSVRPSAGPTTVPTAAPTEPPTAGPSPAPSEGPSGAPTELPTETPREAPTEPPTDPPTAPPTEAPTEPPSDISTSVPTE
jgi:hypothetical protein